MILNIAFIVVGFVFLIKGADWLVSGASSLAKRYNVPDLVIGLTIVAFGTSAPELVVNAVASFSNHSDIVYGNIIGSNNLNLFLILGLTAVIFPISVQKSMVRKEIPFSLIIAVVLLFFSNAWLWQHTSVLSRPEAAILLLLFAAFLYYMFKQTASEPDSVEEIDAKPMTLLKIWTLILVGLTLLVVGGNMVISGSESIAKALGISEKIIGLTIVAAGTSLPELVTSIVAASKKKSDIAVGNVIGSNIFNILLVLAVSGLIRPIEYSVTFNRELLLLIGGTALLVIFMFTQKRYKVDRLEGALFLLIYAVYTVFLIRQEL